MKAAPKPTKEKKQKKHVVNRRKLLEAQLKAMVVQIIAWRDSQQCVMRGRGKCGNGLMWNHLVAQGKSPWLRYDLGNVHFGCGVHNLEDFYGSTVFPAWFVDTFGAKAFRAMEAERQAHIGINRTIPELEELLAHYEELYQNRFFVELDTAALIAAGYYGSTLKGNTL